jgi:hypothetical protein
VGYDIEIKKREDRGNYRNERAETECKRGKNKRKVNIRVSREGGKYHFRMGRRGKTIVFR